VFSNRELLFAVPIKTTFKHMNEPTPKKKTSYFMVLVYIVLGLLALTLLLEMTGMADVAGKREHEQIIDRPHQ